MDKEGFITDVKNISFLMVPWTLITDPEYRDLLMEGKVLYAMMLDRMGLSRKNNWHDDLGRVFIHYTVEEVISTMGCKQKSNQAPEGTERNRTDRLREDRPDKTEQNLRKDVLILRN